MEFGEKLQDLEPFYPDRMAKRILGMGDVMSLIEKAQEVVTEEDAKKMEKKFSWVRTHIKYSICIYMKKIG